MTSPAKPGLFLCKDLMFLSRVTSTANSLGLRVEAVTDWNQGLTKAASGDYRVVYFDLEQPHSVADLLRALPTENPPPVIAFGPHVKVELLSEARRAGCREVMPRSQFNANLPVILQQYAQGGDSTSREV